VSRLTVRRYLRDPKAERYGPREPRARKLENKILREALKVAHGKKRAHLALALITRRGFAVRRVAKTLGVSRSHLPERLREGNKARGGYHKSDDALLLEPVRRLVDERPTYGYRRIGALLNRERLQCGLPRLNHKRIYRLMAQNGLPLERYTGKPPGRAHEGQIITIRPNLR
jgi:hypothetical protein